MCPWTSALLPSALYSSEKFVSGGGGAVWACSHRREAAIKPSIDGGGGGGGRRPGARGLGCGSECVRQSLSLFLSRVSDYHGLYHEMVKEKKEKEEEEEEERTRYVLLFIIFILRILCP